MTSVLSAPGPLLAVSPRVEERLRQGELTRRQVDDFRDFLADVDRDLLHHRIITKNEYTRWFQAGEVSDAQLRHFIKQFSVFSSQFLVAALLKVINAPSLAQMRAGKEILMNELGVVYRKPEQAVTAGGERSDEQKDLLGDPELVNIEGTVDGSVYRHRAAHFEWLLAVGEPMGLGFDDLGKRRLGRPYTLHFCDELQRLYRHGGAGRGLLRPRVRPPEVLPGRPRGAGGHRRLLGRPQRRPPQGHQYVKRIATKNTKSTKRRREQKIKK
jgi:hypothetical protein